MSTRRKAQSIKKKVSYADANTCTKNCWIKELLQCPTAAGRLLRQRQMLEWCCEAPQLFSSILAKNRWNPVTTGCYTHKGLGIKANHQFLLKVRKTSCQDPRKSDIYSVKKKRKIPVFGGFLLAVHINNYLVIIIDVRRQFEISRKSHIQAATREDRTFTFLWSFWPDQRYDGAIKMILPSLHEGSSEENTQGGLSSGGPPPGQWIFSVWDQMISLVVPL